MTETIKLYDLDAYATEFEGKVISCELCEGASDEYLLALDQTLFFPEEGGQSPDKGLLDKTEVLDVQIENGIVYHKVAKAFSIGAIVRGCIDWAHRFSNMQQHSGEHIFSGIVNRMYGYDNVGFHLSDQIVTMDFDGPLNVEQIKEVEGLVNQAIWENVEVSAEYPDSDTLKSLQYRSKKDLEGAVRIVTIDGYDVCACCAPHVKRSGEIGILKVISVSNYKGGVRISFLCGKRALSEWRKKQEVLSGLTGYLTTGEDKLLEVVKKLKDSNQSLSAELNSLKQKTLEEKLKDIPSEERNVILFESGIDTRIGRNIVNTLIKSHEGICGLFIGCDGEGYNFVIGSLTEDCNQIAKILRERLGAKGGGNKQMIQGSVESAESAIRKALDI